jgi:hypothetical protein
VAFDDLKLSDAENSGSYQPFHLKAFFPALEVTLVVSPPTEYSVFNQESMYNAIVGSLRWAHEANLVIRCEDGRWTMEKNRYSLRKMPLSGAILPNLERGKL